MYIIFKLIQRGENYNKFVEDQINEFKKSSLLNIDINKYFPSNNLDCDHECNICHKFTDERLIECISCKKWFHYLCLRIPKLYLYPPSDCIRNNKWCCFKCYMSNTYPYNQIKYSLLDFNVDRNSIMWQSNFYVEQSQIKSIVDCYYNVSVILYDIYNSEENTDCSIRMSINHQLIPVYLFIFFRLIIII